MSEPDVPYMPARPIDFGATPADGALAVDLKTLLATRCLIQGGTGAGKSYALRGLLEALHGRVWQLVVDVEGEYHTLRERYPYVLLAPDGDLGPDPERAEQIVLALMEAGASAILDLSELRKAEGQDVAAAFLDAVMRVARKVPGRVLVAVDEAHRIAPQDGAERASTRALGDVAARGRKRGVGLVVATQRLAKLDKDIAAECASVLIGRTTLGLDLKRAAEALQFSTGERTKLRTLTPGQFFAVGPAFTDEPTVVRTMAVETQHPEPGEVVPHTPAAGGDLARLIAGLRQSAENAPVDGPDQDGDRVQYWHDQAEAQRRRADRAEEQRDQAIEERDRATAEATRLADVLAGIETAARESRASTSVPRRAVSRPAEPSPAAADDDQAEAPVEKPVEKPVARADVQSNGHATQPVDGLDLRDGHRRVLAAVARMEALGTPNVERPTVAVLSDYTDGGGTFDGVLRDLDTAGLIGRDGGTVALTEAGREAAGEQPPATLADLHDGFRALAQKHVGGKGVPILDTIIERHPEPVSRAELGEIHELTVGAGAFNGYIRGLRRIGAVEYRRGGAGGGRVAADPRLFPDQLV